MQIQQDAEVRGGAGPGQSSSANLNHVAKVLVSVLITIYPQGVGGNHVTSVTVGGANAALLAWKSDGANMVQSYYYYAYRSDAGNELVQVNLDSSLVHQWFAVSHTGTKDAESFFECTNTNTGVGTVFSVTVAAGTVGRRIIQLASETFQEASQPTLGEGQVLIDWRNYGGCAIASHEDTETQQEMTATGTNNNARWTSIGTAMLPGVDNVVQASDSLSLSDSIGLDGQIFASDSLGLADNVAGLEAQITAADSLEVAEKFTTMRGDGAYILVVHGTVVEKILELNRITRSAYATRLRPEASHQFLKWSSGLGREYVIRCELTEEQYERLLSLHNTWRNMWVVHTVEGAFHALLQVRRLSIVEDPDHDSFELVFSECENEFNPDDFNPLHFG